MASEASGYESGGHAVRGVVATMQGSHGASNRILDEIVTAVREVTDLLNDIAHASAEQLAGIEQVNRAIPQMDGMTQSSTALVQEAAHSAQEMAAEAAAPQGGEWLPQPLALTA